MKDIIITDPQSNTITAEAINTYTRGLIIGYAGTNPIGYITYDNEYEGWAWHQTIDASPNNALAVNREILPDLIKTILSFGKVNSFKLIEFSHDN